MMVSEIEPNDYMDLFQSTLKTNSEKTLKKQIEGLYKIVEKIGAIVIKIPEVIDNQLGCINTQLYDYNKRLDNCESRMGGLETRIINLKPVITAPLPAPVIAKVEEKPKTKESLRGDILIELKKLFEKNGKRLSED